MTKLYKLKNSIKNYEWGSSTILPKFLGLKNEGNKPYAEMWLGTHPLAPSQTQIDGKDVNLNEVCGELPFLLKLLAVEKPLSIQVHPNKEQAQKGFKKENEAGLAIDSPTRNYKDKNAKSEIICAITPFTLMVGFRDSKEIYANLSDVSSEQRQLIKKLESLYPQDSGVFSPLYLNLITLQPGQGLFIPSGTPHTYISGFGVEFMNNSDNVIRGGLTHKYIDTDEFKRIASPVPFIPQIITPKNDTILCYPMPEENFSLYYIHGNDSVPWMQRGQAVCIVTEGEVKIENQSFKKGESFYFSGCSEDAPVLLNGNFSLFVAKAISGGIQ